MTHHSMGDPFKYTTLREVGKSGKRFLEMVPDNIVQNSVNLNTALHCGLEHLVEIVHVQPRVHLDTRINGNEDGKIILCHHRKVL